eukprot:2164733-Rhodomonas_salina.1
MLSFAPPPTFPAQISRDIEHNAVESHLVYAQDPYGPRLWITAPPADTGGDELPPQILDLPDLYQPPADIYGSMVFAPPEQVYAPSLAPTVAPMYANPMYSSQPMLAPTVAPNYGSHPQAPLMYASQPPQPQVYASQPFDGTVLPPTVAPMYGTHPADYSQFPDYSNENLPMPMPQAPQADDMSNLYQQPVWQQDDIDQQPRYIPPWERGADPMAY